MHAESSNLNFKRLSVTFNCCVQRLVAVAFRVGNIIFEPAVNRLPQIMHKPHERIALNSVAAQNSYCKQIKKLVRTFVALAHFLIN